ncbi:MAG: hypothetical protein DWQ02_06065 [Bacteroidetes bacterium]|nr:MAG: hypothetical protein DWQ02_06065 [Bacteroidota bacterium]
MRKLLNLLGVLFLLGTFSQDIQAQSEVNSIPNNQGFNHHVSLDAGGLLDLVFNSSGNADGPLFVSWRKLGETSNRRMGFGISGSFQTNSFQNSSYFTISYSIGKERFKDFSRRWQVFYGWDVISHVSFQSFDDVNETGVVLGWGPLAGIHFKINEQLWISTEASLAILFGLEGNSQGDANFAVQTQFSPPATVFLGYRF